MPRITSAQPRSGHVQAGGKQTAPSVPAKARSRHLLILTTLFVFVAAPVTLALGTQFDTGNSYATSMLIIVYALVPFFAAFEHSRPKAHDVVVVAVLCALAVVARAAFFWLPYFTPVTGVVIIAGIALGAVPGFMVGTLTLFASNFLFAQGPWTPWQMFAYGLTGFVFGLLAQRGKIPRANLTLKAKVVLCLAGLAFVVCITGPLLDTSSVFMILNRVTPEGALAVYASGLPVNLIHGLATALTLFVLANPLLGQLERIRTKYGLME